MSKKNKKDKQERHKNNPPRNPEEAGSAPPPPAATVKPRKLAPGVYEKELQRLQIELAKLEELESPWFVIKPRSWPLTLAPPPGICQTLFNICGRSPSSWSRRVRHGGSTSTSRLAAPCSDG